MNSISKVVAICLIFIASTESWILEITTCFNSQSPSTPKYENSGYFNRTSYVCKVTVKPSENLTHLVAIVGEHLHLRGKTNADIEIIMIYIPPLDNVTGIPFNIGKNVLPQLIGVSIHGAGITSIRAEDLKQFADIIYFKTTSTKIVSIDSDLFKYTPLIEVLYIQGIVTSVGQNLLDDLKNLKVAAVAMNCLNYHTASTPEEFEWLKGNLTMKCSSTTTSTPPTPVTTTKATSPPVEDCQMRCSLNEEIDELKDTLLKQDALIGDLFQTLLDYSHRISELEKFDAKIITAVNVIRDHD
ncbi:uncharacterized protein LOC119081472 [Bradysia coprophila]|uniref:uncharacterized protein LOC119081472 n=1 Tax=Bradysia coprophila TaxID=38358 RepID=UPI00187D79DA|nr:uncharacterized protein LOC119081472 [Bradysia coprophila]